MGKVEKQKQILLQYLEKNGKITLTQAMELLDVSESSARRFFWGLENDGAALRYYGGIQLLSWRPPEQYSFNFAESQNIKQKRVIAERAVQIIESGDTIYVDSGTTLAQFSKLLSVKIREKQLRNVTVVTNSFNNLNILNNHDGLIIIGGKYREYRKDFCGYIAEETLKLLRFSKCFFGCDGYSPDFGFSTTDFFTARLNEIVLENSEQSFILMDSSKYNCTATVSYTSKHAAGTLITDAPPPQKAAERLESVGTKVIIGENISDGFQN